MLLSSPALARVRWVNSTLFRTLVGPTVETDESTADLHCKEKEKLSCKKDNWELIYIICNESVRRDKNSFGAVEDHSGK